MSLVSRSPTEFTWQTAAVAAVEGEWVKLRFQPLAHCRRCLRGEGCGAGVFSRLFAARGSELWLPAPEALQPGQLVRVGVREQELVRAAAVLYGFPVLSFILAAGLAATVFSHPLHGDLAALVLGLAAGAVSIRISGRWRGRILNPRLESLSGSAVGCESSPCVQSAGRGSH